MLINDFANFDVTVHAPKNFVVWANGDLQNPDEALQPEYAQLLHSWFPFYMGINEQRYGFMDEGWTTAFEYLINIRDFGFDTGTRVFKEFRSQNLVPPFSGADIPNLAARRAVSGEGHKVRRCEPCNSGVYCSAGPYAPRSQALIWV